MCLNKTFQTVDFPIHCVTHVFHIHSLRVLVLRGLGLTDRDITTLSVCAGIKKSGLYSIEHLDLSGEYLGRISWDHAELLHVSIRVS